MSYETPAVVLGAGINGLGVVRSLARLRVPTWLVDADPQRAELRTRSARPLTIGALHGEALIEDLVRLGKTCFAGIRPVLFVTQEESVKTVSHDRERLAGLYRFSLPPPATVDALQHKHGFQRLAEKFGAPIPKLLRVRALDDLPQLTTLHYPVVVKPGVRDTAYSRQFKKAYRVDSMVDAEELVRCMLPVLPDIVVQEWISGPDSNIYFCLQYVDAVAGTLGSFTGRKVRSWPPQVGGTASCVPAPEVHRELSALTTRFFTNAGVVGLASMEYKRDATSGAFRMVEPTIGRTDYQEEIATLNGVNLPFVAYCGEMGLLCPPIHPVGRNLAWRVRSADLQSAVAQQQEMNSGFGGAADVIDALWRPTDPLPWLVDTQRRARHALRRRIVGKTFVTRRTVQGTP